MVAYARFPRKQVQGKYRFQIHVLFGLGFGEVLSVAHTAYEIQNIPGGESRSYEVNAIDLGISPFPVAISGPSSWSEFVADCYVNEFVGDVYVKSAQVAAGAGYGAAEIGWMSGPAEGTVCYGRGWLTAIAPGVTLSRGYMTGGLTPRPVHPRGKFTGL